jgi:hypothetical protein
MSLDTGVPFIGSTVGSTGTDVSTCTVNDTNDVWHCWTADCSGLVTFETCGGPDPNFDTSLSIFDACGGQQIACNDDGCGVQSRVFNVSVTEGTTYYLRVAGRGGDMGQYRVLVNPCRSACCTSDGHCFMATHDECLAGQGFPQLPGTLCMGDLNQDLIDDACELCAGAPDNTPCEDDGNDCTDDLCISNHCSHEPMIAGTPCLDDGDACTNDVCGDAANCTHVDNGACGACCLTTGACIGAIPIATCEGQGGTFLGAGQSCIGDADDDGIDDACEMFEPIPTVSEWGVVVLALGLAVIAKLCFRRGAAEA